jgi:hypothetical protein
MPGAGRSESAAVRFGGATVALVAIVGYLFFGWSFSGAETLSLTHNSVSARKISQNRLEKKELIKEETLFELVRSDS